jgi:hypothetical protein
MGDRIARGWASRVFVQAGLLAAALGAGVVAIPEARACGGFFSRAALESDRRPSLAYEQTLIVFDAEKQREHFVREVVFRASREPFGFVVPTPSRPEVAKVKKSPFAKLREAFPFRRPPSHSRGTGRIAAIGAYDGDGVEVLEVTKVGRFTAFVLSASDASGLSKWLADNGFVSTPEADVWLAHYVKLGFFYVAMRYEPSRHDRGRTTSETVRISFDAPLPYYPYLEPDPPPRKGGARPRLLDVWLASTAEWVPVAPRSGNATEWVRPLLGGDRYTSRVRPKLASAVDASWLPAGDLEVQRFADQKPSRVGFGDVIFVPARADAPGQAPAALARFAAILDPAGRRPDEVAGLLSGRTPASKLPVVATAPGRSFDPDLRDKIAPIEEPTTLIGGDSVSGGL